jgi:hypothetical protein
MITIDINGCSEKHSEAFVHAVTMWFSGGTEGQQEAHGFGKLL